MSEAIKPIKILYTNDNIENEEIIEVEIIPTIIESVDKRLMEIETELDSLSEEIHCLTNNASKIDYLVAALSGAITGLLDIFLVGETEIDEEKIQKILEKKYHTANDDEYKHVKKDGGQVSSPLYHRLDDLAHQPTLLGLVASILVRYFRLIVFIDGTDGEQHIFFADHSSNEKTHKLEMEQIRKAWMGIVFSGLLMWLVNVCEKQIDNEYEGNIPQPLIKMINMLRSAPIIIEIFKTADVWLGHMMSDVSTSQGIPGIFLSFLKQISVLPIFKNTNFHLYVKELYNEGKLNLPQWGGVVFEAFKKQTLPILLNEVMVRGFYFINKIIHEYHMQHNLKNINFDNVIPFGNRTIERMMTISIGTFTTLDTLDAIIEGAINSKGNWGEFGRQVVLRLNFVGIGRLTISLGLETISSFKKSKKTKEEMILLHEALYLRSAKMYYDEKLVWKAAKNTELSVSKFYQNINMIAENLYLDLKSTKESIDSIKQIKTDEIENKNPGLIDELLRELK